MLPGRQLADEWLDFMLSQRNLWPTFTTKGAPTELITERTFRKERRRLQAKHLWMDIKITWDLLHNRMYAEAPTGLSREQIYDLLFNRATKGNQRNPYEEKAYSGPDYHVVRGRAPEVLDINGFIRAFRGKDENAHAVIDTYMDYWQTREGTYQLKRRRLLPDVRDPPEQGDEEVDMKDIWSTTWRHGWHTTRWKRWYERLWGARRFHHFCEDFHRLLLCGWWFLLCCSCFVSWFFCFPAGDFFFAGAVRAWSSDGHQYILFWLAIPP